MSPTQLVKFKKGIVMPFVNKTLHNIDIYDEDYNHVVTIPPTRPPIRIKNIREYSGKLHGVPLYRPNGTDIQNLPPKIEGVYYIVSGRVRTALPHRRDLMQPGDPIRDKNGKVIGCIGLLEAPQ